MSDIVTELLQRKTAREILSLIREVYFSDEYLSFRVDNGSNGTRDLIIQKIKEKYIL